ncbi:hypothetical protein JOM56_015346 [Amanita muscaria]
MSDRYYGRRLLTIRPVSEPPNQSPTSCSSSRALELSTTSPSGLSSSPSPSPSPSHALSVVDQVWWKAPKSKAAGAHTARGRKGNWRSGMFSWFKWDTSLPTSFRMAKIIMSRHTYRKPTVRPPRAATRAVYGSGRPMTAGRRFQQHPHPCRVMDICTV